MDTILHRTGDVDPITHGGGVVLEWGDGPTWFCWDTSDEDVEDEIFEVHEIPVPSSVTEEYDWVDLDPIAHSIGADPSEFRASASSEDLMERVSVLIAIVGHWGAFHLSQCDPSKMTKKQLLDLCGFEE